MIWKIVGIDSGYSGFAAVLENGEPKGFWSAPTYDECNNRYDWEKLLACCFEWKQLGVHTVALENLHALPAKFFKGSIASFARGMAMGAWKTALTAASLNFMEVEPRSWKAFYGIKGEREEQKDQAKKIATERWPKIDFRPIETKPKSRVPDANKCESALIAGFADSKLRIAR